MNISVAPLMGGTDHFIIFNSNAALVAKNVLSTMPGPRSP